MRTAMANNSDHALYLRETAFMDFGSHEVQQFLQTNVAKEASAFDNILSLYVAVRDRFRYDPFHVNLSPAELTASALIRRGSGFCVEKANLLGACARTLGVPSRLGFANVRNHIGTGKVEAALQSDVLVFHGYVELWLQGQWVKATPAFNRSLCEKLNVEPLEFDGLHDSIFQQFARTGQRYMEYLHDYGAFAEIPVQLMVDELRRHYPHLFKEANKGRSGIEFLL